MRYCLDRKENIIFFIFVKFKRFMASNEYANLDFTNGRKIHIDTMLRNKVIQLVERDQMFRRSENFFDEKVKEKVIELDKENLMVLKSIINANNGKWISEKQIGPGRSCDPFVIVLHIESSDNPNLLYFLKVLEDAVCEGDLEKYYLDHFVRYKNLPDHR